MIERNEKEILCPCRKYKEGVWLEHFKGGRLKAHLLRYGFMDGYTRWISEEEDDDEDVHMARNNDIGLEEEMTNRNEDDGAGHGNGKESGNDGGEEDSEHSEEEFGHGGEEVAVVTP